MVVRDVDVRDVVSFVQGIEHVLGGHSAGRVLRARDQVGVLGASEEAPPEIEGRLGAHSHEIHLAPGETSARQDLLAERRECGPRGGGDAQRGRLARGGVRCARLRVRVMPDVVERVSLGRFEKRPGPRVRPRGARIARGRNVRVFLRVVVAGDRHADVCASGERTAWMRSTRGMNSGCVVAVWGERARGGQKAFFLDEAAKGRRTIERKRHDVFSVLGAAEKPRHLRGRERGGIPRRAWGAASARWARTSGVGMIGRKHTAKCATRARMAG